MSEDTIEDATVQLESDQVLLSFVFSTVDEPEEEKIFILCFHYNLKYLPSKLTNLKHQGKDQPIIHIVIDLYNEISSKLLNFWNL